MTSGRKLTEHEADEILRLAGLTTEDGADAFTFKEIARKLDLNDRTVRRWIRQAAVAFGKRTRWQPDDCC